MSETRKTIIFAGAAILLVLITFVTTPKQVTPDAFSDLGEMFYPGFTDPNAARTLEVIEVRPLSSPLTRTGTGDNAQKLLLVISRIVEEPDARTVRFIIEAPNTVPFEPARDFQRPL